MSVLAVEGLQAWYRTGTFGVPRDVRAPATAQLKPAE